MVMDKATSVTVSDILASACGDLRPAMMAVAQQANQELVPGGTDGQVGLPECLFTLINIKSDLDMWQTCKPLTGLQTVFETQFVVYRVSVNDSIKNWSYVEEILSDIIWIFESLCKNFNMNSVFFFVAAYGRTSGRTFSAEVAHRAGPHPDRGWERRWHTHSCICLLCVQKIKS